ncbi:MAG: hypothetical protein QOJ50_1411 [Cryptosporangiaceae bacterium]|nr:hypothetical protein [Cryptosporangiaceae bacterium]
MPPPLPVPPSLPVPPWLRIEVSADPAPVRGECCRDKSGLLAELARALSFPRHFGHNWDALADVLTDLAERGEVAITIGAAEHLLADEPAALRTFLAVLSDIAAGTATGTPPPAGQLWLVLRCADPARAAALGERVAAAL